MASLSKLRIYFLRLRFRLFLAARLAFLTLSRSTRLKACEPLDLPDPSPSMPPEDHLLNGNCQAIERGDAIEGQEDLASQEYKVLLDVMLDTATEDLTLVTMELEEKLQSVLAPSLVGCPNKDPSNSLIANALVEVTAEVDDQCLPDSRNPCYRFAVRLGTFMESILSSADFGPFIYEEFRKSPLVARLELLVPFEEIAVVDIFGERASANPSSTCMTFYVHLLTLQ